MKRNLPSLFVQATCALVCSLSNPAHAQPGSLDPAFAVAGKYVQDFGAQDNLTKVRVQPNDQKIVAVGTALSPAFAGQLLVVRLKPDGTLDEGFNGTGTLLITAFTESYAYDLFFQDDGRIVVVGARADANYQFSMLAMRLNVDGTLDNTFGNGGFSEPEISTADDFAYAVAPLSNGQFLLAGTAIDDLFNNQPVVVRMNADGTIDTAFGTDGVASLPITQQDNKFWNIGLQSDGSIIASGHMDQGLTGGGQFNQDVLAARFTANGQLDPSFGTGGTVIRPISTELIESAFGMAIGADDNIYLCGYTTLPDFSFDSFIMKLDANGGNASTFGTDGLVTFNGAVQDVFTGIILQPDNRILACGTSGGFFFDPRDQLLARYDQDGTLDGSFGTNGYVLNNVAGNFDEANALTLQDDGKIVVAGKANTGANNDITVFRHMNDIDFSVADVAADANLIVYPDPARAGATVTLAARDRSTAKSIQLIDVLGHIRSLALRTNNEGKCTVVLPTDLAPCTYTLRMDPGNGRSRAARLVVNE